MKALFTLLSLVVLLFFGCKKDSPVNSKPKTYLLKTTTYTLMPFNIVTTDQYSYDDQNRVISFKSSGGYMYKYTYDDNNNLATVANYDQSNTLFSNNKFSYNGNTITAQTTDVGDNGGEPYIFTLNNAGQVASSTIDGSQQFTYDIGGNLTSYKQCCSLAQSDTYTYDTKKHPLSMIGAKNFHLMYIVFGVPTTFVNNILAVGSQPAVTYTYTYNSDGFPTSLTTKSTTGTALYTIISYDYIVK